MLISLACTPDMEVSVREFMQQPQPDNVVIIPEDDITQPRTQACGWAHLLNSDVFYEWLREHRDNGFVCTVDDDDVIVSSRMDTLLPLFDNRGTLAIRTSAILISMDEIDHYLEDEGGVFPRSPRGFDELPRYIIRVNTFLALFNNVTCTQDKQYDRVIYSNMRVHLGFRIGNPEDPAHMYPTRGNRNNVVDIGWDNPVYIIQSRNSDMPVNWSLSLRDRGCLLDHCNDHVSLLPRVMEGVEILRDRRYHRNTRDIVDG